MTTTIDSVDDIQNEAFDQTTGNRVADSAAPSSGEQDVKRNKRTTRKVANKRATRTESNANPNPNPRIKSKPKSKANSTSSDPSAKAEKRSAASVTGAITGLHDGYLHGWAQDANNPDMSLAIEVYFDGVFAHLTRADAYVVSAPDGAELNGFYFRVEPSWLESSTRIRARVANQGPWLDGEIELVDGKPVSRLTPTEHLRLSKQAKPRSKPVEGASRVFYAGGLKLVGWALPASDSTEFRQISVMEGERLLARATADQHVGFLGNRAEQGHGFEIDLPWTLSDGQRHQLEVLDETGEPVKGSPIQLCFTESSQAALLIDAWQQSHVDATGTEMASAQTRALPPTGLLDVIEAHERIYPSSFGFAHYPYWYRLYQHGKLPDTMAESVGNDAAGIEGVHDPLSVAVIVIDQARAGDEHDLCIDPVSITTDSAFALETSGVQVHCLRVTPAGILNGLQEAAGSADLVVPVWLGDLLSPHAVQWMVDALGRHDQVHGSGDKQQTNHGTNSDARLHLAGWGYVDCDDVGLSVAKQGEGVQVIDRANPWLKPDWDETLFYAMDYVSHGAFFASSLVKRVLVDHAREIQLLIDRQQPHSVWHAFLACVVERQVVKGPYHPERAHQARIPTPVHVPRVLYHRGVPSQGLRRDDESGVQHKLATGPLGPQAREHAIRWLVNERCAGATLQPVNAHLPQNQRPHQPSADQPIIGWRVQWPLPVPLPLISVIVPTRNGVELLKTVVDGLLHHTDYAKLEVLVVDNDSDCTDTLAYLDGLAELTQQMSVKPSVRVLRYPHPFNYAAINNFAAEQASGELLLLLNNDVEVTDRRWLTEMVATLCQGQALAQKTGSDKARVNDFNISNVEPVTDEHASLATPAIGIVGKKLLWSNGMVQHGGVVVGINGLAAHAFNQCQADDPGYMGLNRFDREQSAVTAACLLLRKADYWAVGGLQANQLPVAFNDVDLCLKIRELGKKVVITTGYALIHHESATRGKEDSPQKLARAKRERDYFLRTWMPLGSVWTDPYYHPGLNHDFVSGPYGGLGRMRDDPGGS